MVVQNLPTCCCNSLGNPGNYAQEMRIKDAQPNSYEHSLMTLKSDIKQGCYTLNRNR